jgi:putative FmdB family regulatory protein
MPIYEYQCEACGHKFEKLQKLSDGPLKDCPACSESTLTKLVSAAAFRLKGGGWYETDFKTGKKKNIIGGSGDSSKSDSSSGNGDAGKSGNKDSSAGKSADSTPKKSDTKSASSNS